MIKRFLKSKKITEKDMLYVGDEQRDVARVKGWSERNLGILGI